ncbi:UNVERIFIED_CONTAM: hypothetical protein Slati_0947200 [Sesamum latifolium]|uniref:Uncharacterized protein n=1 Tax=Sesamum latifolium TaxID=2727402 RepID=A0AAW2XRE6_9LAMI
MARIIQKVPPLLLTEEKNRLDYIPKVVSIGPYHHGKPELRLAEDFKSNAVDMFVSGGTRGRGREFYRAEVAERIREIKSCYFLQEFRMDARDDQQARGRARRRIIQKVPSLLLTEEKNRQEYIPKVVSIGPYHHGKPELRLGEAFKADAVDMIVLGDVERREYYRAQVLERIGEIRSCYVAHSTDEYSDDALAEMVLRDCCFIIIQIMSYASLDPLLGCMGLKSGREFKTL